MVDGLYNSIHCSLQYLLDHTDKERPDARPLLECKFELQAPDMVFSPSLEQDSPNGFCSIVETMLDDSFKCAYIIFYYPFCMHVAFKVNARLFIRTYVQSSNAQLLYVH